ncbi:MAG: gluconeogenesis factor YvcK family protein [Chloroflexota bacterium]
MNLRRWLMPGIGIKRWLGIVFLGLFLLALAVAHVVRQVTVGLHPAGLAGVLIDAVTLQFLPYALRGLIVGVVGIALIGIGGIQVLRAVTEPLRPSDRAEPLGEVLYQKRLLARGPRIVAIGGGTGQSALLRGLKEHTANLTAIVTVADDGGSSGTLRDVLGIPAVGDIRNCIAALADAEPLMTEFLGYRFPNEQQDGATAGSEMGRLGGHAIGNLLIAALTAVEHGDFEAAVRRMNRVLAVRGQVLPVSSTPITLHARTRNGIVVSGQSRIMRTPGIEHVWITPADVIPAADALTAIAEAEIIVLGPGSLFTSLLPVVLVPEIRKALARSSAVRIYVCNVATQAGETAGYDLADHVEALAANAASDLFDLVLANDRFDARAPSDWEAESVRLRWPPAVSPVPRLVNADVVDQANAHRHDPAKLASAILRSAEQEAALRRHAGEARTA